MLDTLCPCCGEVLYRTFLLAADVPVKADGAKLQQDQDGPFVTCGHCNSRVAMVQEPSAVGAPARFRPGPLQECPGDNGKRGT